jgi:hypothetical protein
MPGLGAGAVSLREYPSGLSVVTFDIDPDSYSPFSVPLRGSSTKVLSGCVQHQLFGHQKRDFVIEIQGRITEIDTMTALWTKYRQGGGATEFEWRDWFVNRFRVIFTPGIESFKPTPIIGSNSSFAYTMSLSVIDVLEWFTGAY